MSPGVGRKSPSSLKSADHPERVADCSDNPREVGVAGGCRVMGSADSPQTPQRELVPFGYKIERFAERQAL